MAKEENDSLDNSILTRDVSDSNESFVKKVKSKVSDFIPSSLSKWFGSNDDTDKSRHREDDDDEESYSLQPPPKRLKMPTEDSYLNNNFHFSTPKETKRNKSPQQPIPNNICNKIKFNHFPEPQAGPSGIKSRKLLIGKCNAGGSNTPDELANGEKDSDSCESSASECSVQPQMSRKDLNVTSDTINKPKSVNKLNTSLPVSSRSLFTSTQISNTSLSSRRPSFNPSTFGSPNLIDRTITTKRVTNSPFYNGCTIYGGASAYDRRLGRNPSDLRAQMKNTVQVKPVVQTTSNSTTLSKTAKRILDTLEQYASSTADEAKKIPYPAKKPRIGPLTKFTGAKPYMRINNLSSNNELQVPTVPELLKMKERLQDSTVSVRKIATTSNSSLNVEYKLRTEDTAPKHTNKIKSKVSSTRHKPLENETVEEVKLPNVPLPISTFPKFDFSLPPPPSYNKTPEKPAPVIKNTDNKPTEKTPEKEIREFKFSDPVVIAENLKSIRAINNYIFSEPLSKKNKITCNFKSSTTESVFVPLKKTTKNNGDSNAPLLAGSVVDVFSAKNDLIEKFKPAEGTWECSVCLIRNLPNKSKCEACAAPKPDNNTDKIGNSPMIKASSSSKSEKWECSSCWVKNNASDETCICCSNPKEQPKLKTSTTDNWECKMCKAKNSKDSNECIACKASKDTKPPAVANSFGDAFKKSTNEWVCDTCMVKNSNDKLKCVCCETPKPGANAVSLEKKVQQSNFCFGIETNKINVHGFTFGIKPDSTTEQQPSSSTSSIFGNTPSTTSTNFSFGIKPPTSTQPETKNDETTKTPETKVTPMFNSTNKSEMTTIFQNPSLVPQKESQSKNNVDVTTTSSTVIGVANSTTETAPKIPFGTTQPDENTAKSGSSNEILSDTKIAPINNIVTTTTPSNLFTFGMKRPMENDTFGSTAPIEPPKSMFKMNSADLDTNKTPTFNFNSTTTAPSIFSPPKNSIFTPAFNTAPAPTQEVTKEIKPFTFDSAKPPEAAPFQFGQQLKIEEPPKPSFSFGSAPPNASVTPTFNFGSNVTNPAAPVGGGFNFAKVPPTPPQNPVFNQQPSLFSSTAPVPPESVPAQNFASPPQIPAPIFGQAQQPAQNGGFSFGNLSNSAPKGGFSFGSTQSVPSPAAPVFGFGAANAQQPSQSTQGGFNFGSTAPPTFDANIKPTFNFTSGNVPATFTAQPTGEQQMPARRIRKAIRRTQR